MPFAQTYAGLRVLDLSENIAGPLACMILADLGADVIKVERPGVGEATRGLPPTWPVEGGAGEATVFLGFNRNKRSLAVDLRRPAARDAVLRIGRGVDVVVESFRPGVATRLGLDFDAFAAGNDRLVHCAVSAFGTGPIGHDRAGYDALIQAYSGILEATGEADGGPCRAAPSVIDMTTGMWAALSIQAALHRRETAGAAPGAQRLEATLVDTGLFLMTHQIMGYLGAGTFPGRLGAAAPSAAPYNVWPTADGPIMIATSTDRTYRTLCEVLGAPELADDPRFRAVSDRLARRDELDALIGECLRSRGAQDWLDALWAAGVPAGPVNDLAAALADPLTKERALLAPAEPGRIPDLHQLHLPMDRGREAPLRQPPAVGEHTGEVLAEAGFDPDEITQITGQ